MYTLSGVSVSEGVAEGPALVISKFSTLPAAGGRRSFDFQEESALFQKASVEFATRLHHVVTGSAPDKVRDLFSAAAAYITNASNARDVIALIEQGMSAAEASTEILLKRLGSFDSGDDEEIKNEFRELTALTREFISSLHQGAEQTFMVPKLTEPAVIIAADMTPARFLCLRTDLIRGLILEAGKASGHLSVVLRDLCIPSIFGVAGATSIGNGEHVLVDANNGVVMVEPPQDTARLMLEDQPAQEEEILDDEELKVMVTPAVGAQRELEQGSTSLRHGLGLLRSEFLFLSQRHEPTEEEMLEIFAKIFANIPASAPIPARTFDFAGDKTPVFKVKLDVSGPLRGYGAKVGTALLKTEIRALLRAAPERPIRILFPLITRVSEVRYLNDLLAQCMDELGSEELPHSRAEVALMIETPAAVLSAAAYTRLCSMFVIGTNSLAEYASAPRPPDEAFTPVLAKMIALTCKAAAEAGIPITIAGRFAMREELLPFFIQLGASHITVNPHAMVRVRSVLERQYPDLEPHYNPELFARVEKATSGRDLTILINSLDYNG